MFKPFVHFILAGVFLILAIVMLAISSYGVCLALALAGTASIVAGLRQRKKL